ncbi:CPBP family intramembrane glutamic endopeptidase [Haloarchaeobius sp. TZWWS8]|uniref:CPBP family intramembrane glutamic endopeptidase n=1 Tax=Haloarchaeobius sp. TZWWS8 TaxID=3446121 RepID=UPI003EBBDBED
MANWDAFASVTVIVCGLLLFLAYQTTVASRVEPPLPGERVFAPDSHRRAEPQGYSPAMLLVNVALTQGLFLGILVGAAVLSGVPRAALGVGPAGLGTIPLAVGGVLGVVLYVANRLGSSLSERLGLSGDDDDLRSQLAPSSARGWAVLMLGVLPTVAVFEEFLFRAALVGALSAGYGISPWLLAVASSLAFAVGHGMQGPAGIVVTGAVGFVLAAVFIHTGSLLAVVVAHYLVNALEFVIHEGLGVEWLA